MIENGFDGEFCCNLGGETKNTFGVWASLLTWAIELEYFSTIFSTSGSGTFSVEETMTTSFR
jgi:hypothetical protein